MRLLGIFYKNNVTTSTHQQALFDFPSQGAEPEYPVMVPNVTNGPQEFIFGLVLKQNVTTKFVKLQNVISTLSTRYKAMFYEVAYLLFEINGESYVGYLSDGKVEIVNDSIFNVSEGWLRLDVTLTIARVESFKLTVHSDLGDYNPLGHAYVFNGVGQTNNHLHYLSVDTNQTARDVLYAGIHVPKESNALTTFTAFYKAQQFSKAAGVSNTNDTANGGYASDSAIVTSSLVQGTRTELATFSVQTLLGTSQAIRDTYAGTYRLFFRYRFPVTSSFAKFEIVKRSSTTYGNLATKVSKVAVIGQNDEAAYQLFISDPITLPEGGVGTLIEDLTFFVTLFTSTTTTFILDSVTLMPINYLRCDNKVRVAGSNTFHVVQLKNNKFGASVISDAPFSGVNYSDIEELNFMIPNQNFAMVVYVGSNSSENYVSSTNISQTELAYHEKIMSFPSWRMNNLEL